MTTSLFQHGEPERPCNAKNWQLARLEARGLADLRPNWDGEGALPVAQQIIDSVLHLFKEMEHRGDPAPGAVYPLASGALMAEWHYGDQTVVSAEIREPGRAEVLVWHPSRSSIFEAIHWSEVRSNPCPRPVVFKQQVREVMVRYLAAHAQRVQTHVVPESLLSSSDESVKKVSQKIVWESLTVEAKIGHFTTRKDNGSQTGYTEGNLSLAA